MKKTRKGKHNGSNLRVYRVWIGMKSRCFNSKHPTYKRYGARGITVCDRWKNSFANFFADMGNPPTPKHQIERIDNDKGYSPENCRWATVLEQAHNRSNSAFLTYKGTTKTMSEWAVDLGLKYSTLQNRIYRWKWTVEQALSTPALTRKTFGQD